MADKDPVDTISGNIKELKKSADRINAGEPDVAKEGGPGGKARLKAINKQLEDAGANNDKPKRKRTMADAIDDGIDEAKDA